MWELFRNRYLSFAFRVALGSILVASGAGKLPMGSEFVDTVAEYGMLPHDLGEFYGVSLPWVEIVIGSLLIVGLTSRFASGIAIVTILSFVIANSVMLYRGLNVECDCFGPASVLQTRDALLVDFAMLIMAFQVFVHKDDFLSLDSIVLRRGSLEPPAD